jgi:hypothetical protein
MTRLEQRARELADLVCDPRGDGDHAVQPEEISEALVKLAREFAEQACAEILMEFVCKPERLTGYRDNIAAAIKAAEGEE